MTTPPDKAPTRWLALAGIWLAVNLGLPCLLLSLGGGSGSREFWQFCFLSITALIVISNGPLAWLISLRRLWLCVIIFLGSLALACAVFIAGCMRSFHIN
jgi:hypothetical protein